MSDFTYLAIAYAIIWAGTFLYLVKLQVDYFKLNRDIELLAEVAKERK
jgi:CcmD family protein